MSLRRYKTRHKSTGDVKPAPSEGLGLPTGDGAGAGRAALGEQLPEAVGAVGLLVAAGEALAGQAGVAVGAGEALAVPRLLLVRHAAGRDDLPPPAGVRIAPLSARM